MITFVGAGRRVELLRKFYELDTVQAIEKDKDCPIFKADFPVFRLHVDDLDAYKYGVVIPLQDSIAARYSQNLLKHKNVIVSPSAHICYDKKMFEDYAKICPWGEHYPFAKVGNVVLKPRYGHGSMGIQYQFLVSLSSIPSDYIAQEYIAGAEYTADCFFDNDGHYVYSVVRERTRVCGGEVIESQIVENPKITEICKLFDSRLNELYFRGAVNIQFIQNENVTRIIEVNSRFGGGYTLSIEAGMPAHKWTLDLANDNPIFTDNIKIRKLKLVRSFRDHYFEVQK